MIEVTTTDGIAVMEMKAEENRFNLPMLDAFDESLAAVEADESAQAVLLTGEGKFFSNGLDLEWMTASGEDATRQVVQRLQLLYLRLLSYPMPVIAAVNGHAFAGGGMLALACDERVMREDRGYFCLPEVDINIPFLPGMSKLVQAKLTPDAAHKAMLSGCRFTGPEAVEWGIASTAVPEDQVLTVAAERAAPLAGKGRETVATIKKVMYASAIETLALQESF